MVNLLKPVSGKAEDSTAEFYTVEETGDSGLSQTGLATLCGVSRQAIITLEKTLVTSEEIPDIKVNGKPVGNIRIYTAAFCAATIQHYDDQENEVAKYSIDQFLELGINQWIQSVTGWKKDEPSRTYIPYWYRRLTLFTVKTRVPDGWWSVFEELAKMMRELEGYGYVLPDASPTTGKLITPDISIGKLFCKHMRTIGYDVDSTVRKYKHYYPDGRDPYANIYPDEWLPEFRTWFNNHWKPQRLRDYLSSRDPEALPSIAKLLGLPEGGD